MGTDSAPNHAKIWKQASRDLKETLSEANFTSWFQHTEALALDGNTFVLGVPSIFAKDWIENHHLDALREAVHRASGRNLSVALVTDESLGPNEVAAPVETRTAPVGNSDPGPVPTETLRLHPKYNFDSFVIGSSNRFAHAAALAVAEAPAQAYNPLFIYGAAGLGKTHLLHAIGRYVGDFHTNMVVRYVSTEQFMNEFILALQRRTIPQFHHRYRAADLLL
ncbi:MAG TPA: DnaA/Hda family protein, partial [Actinomycetota bacterium]|nr:DnaA/Hda family protein [Actinomycetota bacterium]